MQRERGRREGVPPPSETTLCTILSMKSHMFFPFSVLSDGINSRCWEIDKKERNCSVPITVALTSFDSSTGSLLQGIGISKLILWGGGEAIGDCQDKRTTLRTFDQVAKELHWGSMTMVLFCLMMVVMMMVFFGFLFLQLPATAVI